MSVASSPAPASAGGPDPTRTQIRGSSLLLAGRGVSLAGNLATQVLIVRYLSTTEYGAWAYAISVVGLLQNLASFGLDRAMARFVSIYYEQRRYEQVVGTIVLILGVVLIAGFALVAGIHAFPDQLARLVRETPQPVTLLLVLIFLVPVEELDRVTTGLLAVFNRVHAIFLRRQVLGPALRLGVIVVLTVRGSDVAALAYGYLAASLAGLFLNLTFLVQVLHKIGLFGLVSMRRIRLPARETFAFVAPLLISDMVWPLAQASAALLLGYFQTLDQVALFRVVMPLATLNLVVMRTYTMLYTPTAARLFAKNDYREINELYWRTAAWLAVLSFPIFALTFSAARPLTVWLYGAQYEAAAGILPWLAIGQYVVIALGFNILTQKVVGRTRSVMVNSLMAAALCILLNVALIPRFGAFGAAIGTAATAIVHAVLQQISLRRVPDMSSFDSRYAALYVRIAASIAALFVAQQLLSDAATVVVAGIVSLLVVVHSKETLRVVDTFPELLRFRLARVFLT